jgi:hypothetical protein
MVRACGHIYAYFAITATSEDVRLNPGCGLGGVLAMLDKHILRAPHAPACARARACLRLPVLIKHCPPWPVWGKEGQSGWEGQSKRGTGWTRGGMAGWAATGRSCTG